MSVSDLGCPRSLAFDASIDIRGQGPRLEGAMPPAPKGTPPRRILSTVPAGKDSRRAYLDYLARLSPESRRLRFGSTLTDRQLLEWFAAIPSRKLFLIDAEEHVRGVVELFDAPGLEAELAISVEDAFQGRGHGRRLFAEGLEWASALGLKRLLVMCDAGNRRMCRLLAGAGVAQHREYGQVTAWIRLDRT